MDEIPINNYNIDSLRSQTGIYLSHQDIFHGSLLENITMGNNNIGMDEISRWVEKLGLKSFISSLKYGFDTQLDPLGDHLPGNVVRKILLLRALINKPRLILLEEPWLGFTDEVKNKIQEALINDTAGSTVMVISNDESFASKCSKRIQLNRQ